MSRGVRWTYGRAPLLTWPCPTPGGDSSSSPACSSTDDGPTGHSPSSPTLPSPPARGHAPDTYWVSLPSRRVLPVSWRHLVVIEDIDLLTYIFHSAVHGPHSSAVRPPRTARTLHWCLLPPHSPRLWLCQDPACLTLVSSDRHCCHTCGLSALASAFLRTRQWLSGLGIPQGAAAPLPPLA